MARLIDQVQAGLAANGTGAGLTIEDCMAFGDLLWPPSPTLAEIEADPALTIKCTTRWVALQRVRGQIRYYAAPLPRHTRDAIHRDEGEDEEGPRELGVVTSVEDAVLLVAQYLSGMAFAAITARRGPW